MFCFLFFNSTLTKQHYFYSGCITQQITAVYLGYTAIFSVDLLLNSSYCKLFIFKSLHFPDNIIINIFDFSAMMKSNTKVSYLILQIFCIVAYHTFFYFIYIIFIYFEKQISNIIYI